MLKTSCSKTNLCLKIVIYFILFFPANVFAKAGLSTTFLEVMLNNLEPGKTYSVNKNAATLLQITNTGSTTFYLKIEPIIPKKTELKPGYEPIPDINWIKIDTDTFRVNPGETVATDILVIVPPKNEFWNKKYQVYIWSHTVGDKNKKGVNVTLGINSKLLLIFKPVPKVSPTPLTPPSKLPEKSKKK